MMCCSASPRIQEIDAILFEPNPYEVDITHFELHHLLGGGGFGIVQYATKLTDGDKGTDYAIKSLSKVSVLKRSTGFVSIYAELKILTLLNHPFICNAHYAFQDHCYLFLVLDLARTGDMRYNLSLLGGVFSEEMAKFYVCQVILALEYCHMLRILHRDIKPENILLNEDGYIKLTDFGVSKFLSPQDDCRSTSGTHGYMAPEVYISPTHSHGVPSDWFSLGVTLHEFVIGKRPFETKRIKACQNNPCNLPLKYLDTATTISPALKSFLAHLLCTQPFRRLRGGRGAGSLRSHEWLRHINWTELSKKSIPPPFLPSNSQRMRCVLSAEEASELMKRHLEADVVIAESDQLKFKKYAYRNVIVPHDHALALERFPNDPSPTQPSVGFASPFSLEEEMDVITIPRSKPLRGSTVIVAAPSRRLSADRIPPKISEEDTTLSISPPVSPPLPAMVTCQMAQDSAVREKKKRAGCDSSSGQSFTPLRSSVSLWEFGKRVWRGDISSSSSATSVASQYPPPIHTAAAKQKYLSVPCQHSPAAPPANLKSIILKDTE